MKPVDKNTREILDQALGLYSKPSASQIESARERSLKRLQAENGVAVDEEIADSDPVRPSSTSRWPVFVAVAAAIAIAVFIPATMFRNVPAHRAVPAVVEAVDGTRNVEYGEAVLTGDTSGTVLALLDGSRIEIRSQSELALEQALDGTRIRLSRGGVIVTAAKQRNGHLYVQTKDVTVTVIGTVFLVNTEETGSRVAVIQGEVQVQQGAAAKKLVPGEQVATNPLLKSVPMIEDIAWSRNAAAHLALLQQSLALLQQTAIVPAPSVPKRLEFEVASVKPAPRPSAGVGLQSSAVYCHGVDGPLGPYRGTPIDVPQGRCIGRNVNLISLIAIAYDVKVPTPGQRLRGGPDWTRDAWDSGFQIDAKAEDPEHVTKEQLRQMLQSLAEDRFKLKISRETREVDGNILVVARGGQKVQETSGEEALTRIFKRPQGQIEVSITGKASMKTFAEFLSFGFPLPDKRFLDKTGLMGIYAIHFSFSFAPPPPGEGGGRGGAGTDPGAPAVAALAAALQEQLGLRLETAKVSDEFIVIEHAEKPAEN